MKTRRYILLMLGGAVTLTLPWLLRSLVGGYESTLVTVALSGAAVLGASFLLAWGAETAEKDVPRAFALAILAVLAVAPEYAVDALYAWQAGQNPASDAAHLAVANMTGANRILIGIGWAGIALFSIYRATAGGATDHAINDRGGTLADSVQLDRSIATEIMFLTAATVFAFIVPVAIGGSGLGIDAFDTIVLVGLYFAYILVVLRGDVDQDEAHVGVPAYLQELRKSLRIPAVLALFAYAGFLIFSAVEPFAHGLEHMGTEAGIPPFFMIQWIAPLASESPELVITAYLVNKARTTASFNALISSKLNQWTLLIGTLAVVYSISLGRYGILPFGPKQAAEIWLTAAQSLFALAILVNFEISVREAVALLVLFLSQVVGEFVLIRLFTEARADELSLLLLYGFTALYLLLAAGLFAKRRAALRDVFRIAVANARGRDPDVSPPADD
ncbi:sodium/calcium exchanger protein [Halobaculum sp. P14]|uniref:sodium/calcium exchanger protein n=1 Tax=Halobaculum sp. P14 TaxID=3421638 RepID=UPI003EBEEA61